LFNQSKQYLLQSQATPLLLAINFAVLFLLKKEAQKGEEEKNHLNTFPTLHLCNLPLYDNKKSGTKNAK
jgi:hypothetical protein